MFFAAAKRAQTAGACMIGSEADFLALIDRFFPNHGMLVGRGDDCAVFSCPEKMCVTSDLFIEDVHFRRRYFSPFDIGKIIKIGECIYFRKFTIVLFSNFW